MGTTSSITKAPNYSLHRDASATDGATAISNKSAGMNTNGYESAHIQVVPGAGIDPGVTVQWWSEEAGEFINEHTALTKAGVGAGIAYEFTVECKGRFLFVKVDAATKVYVSGFGRNHPE